VFGQIYLNYWGWHLSALVVASLPRHGHSRQPTRAAFVRRVWDVGLTSSRANSSSTVPWWPPRATHESGVRPYQESGVLGLTSSRPNSSFTTPSWPFPGAQESDVRRNLFELSGLTYFLPNRRPAACGAFAHREPMLPGLTNRGPRNNLTTPSCPHLAAYESAVRPEFASC